MKLPALPNSLSLSRLGTNEHTIMAVLAFAVGIGGGYGAIGFRHLIDFFQSIAYGSSESLLEVVKTLPWYLRILLPALGGMVVGPLVYFGAREAKGHGVPEVMEAVALRNGFIRKRVVVIKSLASAITIGTGGSVGREGPIVQIGSAIGSTIGQLLHVSADRMKILVGCGAAAGIAATFNAPIAGSMFALEIILGDFGLATFSPIIISSVTATAISRHYLGDFPAFLVPQHKMVSFWEFPFYLGLGLFCAVIAVIFIKVLYRTEDIFDELKFPEYLKAILGGAALGAMSLLFPHLLGVGYGAIDQALMGLSAWWVLLLLIPFKILATSITIGSGGSGGIFAPSLFLGAMAGSLFGMGVHTLFPELTATPGAYGLVGMAAVVGGTTHGPLTAILIIFEMTGDYKIILPLMTTCIISTVAGRQMMRESIYTLKLIRRGIDIRAGKEVNVLKSIPVKEVMNPNVETLTESLTMEQLADIVSKSKHNSFPVLDEDGNLTGMLSYIDYRDAVFDENLKDLVVVKELASSKVVTVTLDDNLFDALEKISVRDFSLLPVVDSNNPKKLIGILTRRDIIGAYTRAVVKKSLFIRPGEK
ncbi:MAG: chloride channel protein [Deltaproteobacteria bacterium]|nr:chloride channel protein [Deltaproteobacteria bacterium]MBW2151317.1 chloride channel protein [Deltaproteobacteria bacterium]